MRLHAASIHARIPEVAEIADIEGGIADSLKEGEAFFDGADALWVRKARRGRLAHQELGGQMWIRDRVERPEPLFGEVELRVLVAPVPVGESERIQSFRAEVLIA